MAAILDLYVPQTIKIVRFIILVLLECFLILVKIEEDQARLGLGKT